jgi:GNAT superfamily N-acetyltransferase
MSDPRHTPELRVRLIAVDRDDVTDRAELVAYINATYKSELPLTDAPIVSGAIRFFWAVLDHVGFDDDGTRVGCTGYMPKTPYLAEGVKTVVDPAQRGRGVGAAISQALEDEVRRAGFAKIMSTILIGNIAMIIIKLKQGFIIEGIHMDHEKPGLHEYSLGKVFR